MSIPVNKFEQVSRDDNQMSVVGGISGPMSKEWASYVPCPGGGQGVF